MEKEIRDLKYKDFKLSNITKNKIIVQELIDKAIAKYPVSIYYKGQLSEEDIFALEKVCDVRCFSVYMNGSATYSIRFRGMANGDKQT